MGMYVRMVRGGVTSQYTVDSRIPAGYAQVLAARNSSLGVKYYIYGLDLLSQWTYVGDVPTVERPGVDPFTRFPPGPAIHPSLVGIDPGGPPPNL